MAIQGIEWVIVGVIIVILFLWGPDKLPKIARSIGQAKKEFERAQRNLEEDLTKAAAPTTRAEPQAPDDKLIEVAKALNIPTEGKTRDEIARAIVEKSQKSG